MGDLPNRNVAELAALPLPPNVVAFAALPLPLRAALIVALVHGSPDEGPPPWRDGCSPCHCTHCEGCGRLYRSTEIAEHRDACLIRLVVRGASSSVVDNLNAIIALAGGRHG